MAYVRAQHPASGRWGKFLDAMRREREWSAVQAWENLHAVLGLSPKSVAIYKAMEQGTRHIRPDEEERLRAYFGKGPDDQPAAEAEALTHARKRMVSATEDNTDALHGVRDAVLTTGDAEMARAGLDRAVQERQAVALELLAKAMTTQAEAMAAILAELKDWRVAASERTAEDQAVRAGIAENLVLQTGALATIQGSLLSALEGMRGGPPPSPGTEA